MRALAEEHAARMLPRSAASGGAARATPGGRTDMGRNCGGQGIRAGQTGSRECRAETRRCENVHGVFL